MTLHVVEQDHEPLYCSCCDDLWGVLVADTANSSQIVHCISCSRSAWVAGPWQHGQPMDEWGHDGSSWFCAACEGLFLHPLAHDCGASPDDLTHARWVEWSAS